MNYWDDQSLSGIDITMLPRIFSVGKSKNSENYRFAWSSEFPEYEVLFSQNNPKTCLSHHLRRFISCTILCGVIYGYMYLTVVQSQLSIVFLSPLLWRWRRVLKKPEGSSHPEDPWYFTRRCPYIHACGTTWWVGTKPVLSCVFHEIWWDFIMRYPHIDLV